MPWIAVRRQQVLPHEIGIKSFTAVLVIFMLFPYEVHKQEVGIVLDCVRELHYTGDVKCTHPYLQTELGQVRLIL